jgi:hypothetical protein
MAKRMFSVSIDQKGIDGLINLSNKAAMFPNRIISARARATDRSVRMIRRKLENSHGYRLVKHIEIDGKVTGKKSTITVRIPRAKGSSSGDKQSDKDRALWQLNIMLNGRRAFRSKRSGRYTLREESQGKYGKHLYNWSVPAKSPNHAFVKNVTEQPAKIFREIFMQELAREGFGVRGGVSGISADRPSPQLPQSGFASGGTTFSKAIGGR